MIPRKDSVTRGGDFSGSAARHIQGANERYQLKAAEVLKDLKAWESAGKRERKKHLDNALADRGWVWPPSSVYPSAHCRRLYSDFVDTSAFPVKLGGSLSELADAIVDQLEHSTEMLQNHALTGSLLDSRIAKLDNALRSVGLKPSRLITECRAYNDFICEQKDGTHVWSAVEGVIAYIDCRRKRRKEAATRLFNVISGQPSSTSARVINQKSLLRSLAKRRAHDGVFLTAARPLFHGRSYLEALKSINPSGRPEATMGQFEAWLLSRWEPKLPSTDDALRDLNNLKKQ